MESSGVSPIHNLKIDGNILIDVILIHGALNVRIIDYRSHQNREFLFKNDSKGLQDLPYPIGVKQLVANGFKYCRLIARLLALHDLSSQAKKVKELLEKYPNAKQYDWTARKKTL